MGKEGLQRQSGYIKYAKRTIEERRALALTRGVPAEICVGKKIHAGHHKRDRYWTYWYRTDRGEPWPQICGARIKYSNGARRCSKPEPHIYKNGRCRYHGGTNPGGPTKDGKRSILRGPLADAHSRVEEDRHLLDLRTGISLMDIRLEDLSSRMENGDSPLWRKRVMRQMRKVEDARGDGDKEEEEYQWKCLVELVEDGCDVDQAWEELTKANKERATRAEKAADIALRGETILRPAQVQAFMYRVIDVLHEECNEALFTRVSARIVEDVLDGRLARLREAEAGGSGPLLSGVQGPGARLRARSPGEEAMAVSADVVDAAVHQREGDGADEPRPGEDDVGSDGCADVPVDTQGRSGNHDGAYRPPGEEPAVGGDRKATRGSRYVPPRDAGHDAAEDRP